MPAKGGNDMKKRMHRVLSCLLLCAALTGLMTTPASAARFSDVPAKHWAADEIQRCVELGIFGGVSADRFGLGQSMTRSAVARVLCRFFGWDTSAPDIQVYQDVPVDASYAGAVTAAYEHGVFTGQQADFRPREAITREELAVALVRALGYGSIAGLAQELPNGFEDVTTNAGYITMAADLGLMGGTSATAFSPDRTATREQVAVILIRLYDKLHSAAPGKMGILAPETTLPDLAGYEAVAVAGFRLSGTSVQKSLSAKKTAETLEAVRQAGGKALLYVTGSASALRTPAKTAENLAAAVEDTGYDGLVLDIPSLKAEKSADLTTLAQALDSALGDKLLYVTAEAPARAGAASAGYDFAALAAAADRLVLRVAACEKKTGTVMTAAMEPLDEVYYALRTLEESVGSGKLSLLLTTTGSAWHGSTRKANMTAGEISQLLAEGSAALHYSTRYGCAYLSDGSSAVWFLDGQAAQQRCQLLRAFGVSQVCLSDLNSVSTELLEGLE